MDSHWAAVIRQIALANDAVREAQIAADLAAIAASAAQIARSR